MINPLDTSPPPAGEPPRSHLFLVRVWAAPDAEHAGGWSGKLQHVVSGESHAFQDWASLVTLLQAMLPTAADTPARPAESEPLAPTP
jgi:hypothetical protein